MNKICIAGSGIMCEGIAHVFAEKGFDVIIWNSDKKTIHSDIYSSLEQLIYKYNVNISQRQAILSRITITADIESAFDCNLVIDVSNETIEMKKSCFRNLDQICTPDTIFTSNTSAFLINGLAGSTNRQDKVIGLHFFKPVAVMKHVEVLRGMETSDQTLAALMTVLRTIGKKPVEVAEVPGFMISRLPVPMIKETEALW